MSQFRAHVWTFLRAGIGVALAAFLITLTLLSSHRQRLADAGLGPAPGQPQPGLLSLYLHPGPLREQLGAACSELGTDLAAASVPLLLLAVLLYGVVQVLTMVRWDYLLRVQGVHLRFWDIARLTMIGVFFNLAIPGAVSGDLVKMAYVARQQPGKEAECILTIIIDRILGLLGLLCLASCILLLNLPFLLSLGSDQRLLQAAAFTVGLGSIAGIVGVLVIEFRGRLLRVPLLRDLTDWGGRRLPAKITAVIVRFTAALEQYRQRRRAVLIGLLLSVAVHSCLAVDLYVIGHSLGERALSVREYFLGTQVANAVAAIPVTPAGVGSRDFVIKSFLNAMHATPGKAGSIPVTFTLVILFWGLVGGVIFIATPNRRTAAAGPP